MISGSFVCPFCPLHCDDLDAAKLPSQLPAPTAPQQWSQPLLGVTCPLLARRIGGAIEHDAGESPASEATLALARQWLRQAASVRLVGRVIDLETARAVSRFAQRTGAEVRVDCEPAAGAGSAAAYRETFAREGIYSATIAAAALPHNHLIQIGDTQRWWPRLDQRLAAAGGHFRWSRSDALAQRLALLRRLLRRPEEPDPSQDPDVATARTICQTATGIIFLVAPDRIDAADARAFWSTMIGLLRDLNRSRRAALLHFDDAMTLRSVLAWRGQPPATGPEWARPLDAGPMLADVDLVVELTVPSDLEAAEAAPAPDAGGESAAGAATSADRGGKRITIGWRAAHDRPTAHDRPAAHDHTVAVGGSGQCHLPASTAGVGRAAVVIRGDGSVSLPLRPLQATRLPAPAAVLDQLTDFTYSTENSTEK